MQPAHAGAGRNCFKKPIDPVSRRAKFAKFNSCEHIGMIREMLPTDCMLPCGKSNEKSNKKSEMIDPLTECSSGDDSSKPGSSSKRKKAKKYKWKQKLNKNRVDVSDSEGCENALKLNRKQRVELSKFSGYIEKLKKVYANLKDGYDSHRLQLLMSKKRRKLLW